MSANTSTKRYETTALHHAYEFHNSMRKMQLMLAYQGDVSQRLTKVFSSLTATSLANNMEDDRVKRRLFHVMVESLQNLSKHSHNHQTGHPIQPGQGIFLVSKRHDCYAVVTGNVVPKHRIQQLREQLNHINSLSPQELKAYHKTTLRNTRLSEKSGAGLGFIDMAQKTGSKVEFQFVPLNEQTSFFLYRLCINRSGSRTDPRVPVLETNDAA